MQHVSLVVRVTQELAERIAAEAQHRAADNQQEAGLGDVAAGPVVVEDAAGGKDAAGGVGKSKDKYSAFRKINSWRDVQQEIIFAIVIVRLRPFACRHR